MKIFFLILILFSGLLGQIDGKKVFEQYCWGCHHQTSLAFGPSFSEIASKRTESEIISYIFNPKLSYKSFGYRRSVMPSFNLTQEEYLSISQYILSFHPTKGNN